MRDFDDTATSFLSSQSVSTRADESLHPMFNSISHPWCHRPLAGSNGRV